MEFTVRAHFTRSRVLYANRDRRNRRLLRPFLTAARSPLTPVGSAWVKEKHESKLWTSSAWQCDAAVLNVRIDDSLDGIDWVRAKVDLVADGFDNGRSPEALSRSFHQSQYVAVARDGDRSSGWRGCSPMGFVTRT